MKIPFFLTLTTSLIAQGPLDPPSGAPIPGMKTLQEVFNEVEDLDQIESRTPVSSLPFTIDTPGSYYLTGNLTSTTRGIDITASNVTLDLNGFNVSGTSHFVEGIGAEGEVGSPLVGIEIKNGTITGFENSIELNNVNQSTIKNIRCSGADEVGILLSGTSGECNGNSISYCHVSETGSASIRLRVGFEGQCNRNSITHCIIRDCLTYGIILSAGEGEVSGNIVGNNIIRNISKAPNQSDTAGIRLYKVEETRVEGNHISQISNSSTTSAVAIFSTGTPSGSGNLIVNNFSSDVSNPFFFSSNDTYGPEITLSGTITSTNPWANFSR